METPSWLKVRWSYLQSAASTMINKRFPNSNTTIIDLIFAISSQIRGLLASISSVQKKTSRAVSSFTLVINIAYWSRYI